MMLIFQISEKTDIGVRQIYWNMIYVNVVFLIQVRPIKFA